MEPRFVPNEPATDLFRKYTLSFPGGSLTATKDVILAMFEPDNLPDLCSPEEKQVSRKQSTWTAYPGGPTRVVEATTYVKKNYSNGSSGRAAGGEPIQVLINGDYWTARLTGTHQDFMDYLCQEKDALKDGFTFWRSQKGKPYSISDNSQSQQ